MLLVSCVDDRFTSYVLALIIFGIVIDLGGGPTHDRLGFRYWKSPGAFNQYMGIAGAKGRFLAFFSAFLQAAL
jgi:amino acid transporter